MCGLVGFLNAAFLGDWAATIRKMNGTLSHRGPDDEGVWIDEAAGIALGHRRLAILDLSPAGHQPMASACGRYVLVFNGEIYNHLELRQELTALGAAPPWRGHSDTETLLAAFSHWGVTTALEKLVGMFALALWDRKTRTLTLARDRIGEKPLYYGWVNGALVFASELKAIRAYPAFANLINRDALALYFRYSWIPAPYSIYEHIWKLPAGTYLQWPAEALSPNTQGTPQAYWLLESVIAKGLAQPFQGTEDEAATELERLLCQSLKGQLLADVPLGAFLSGGVDSSTVVALMQSLSSQSVKTFSIGFYEDAYNEAQYAKAVAQHLGTDHTEYYLTGQEARDVIPKLTHLYDEPFADSSQIPTHLVSMIARQEVTVALSGDGGDELFGGYVRYLLTPAILGKIERLPKPVRRTLASLLKKLSPRQWDQLFGGLSIFLPQNLRYTTIGDKIAKLAKLCEMTSDKEVYLSFLSLIDLPSQFVLNSQEPLLIQEKLDQLSHQLPFESYMMALDLLTYLPDDILVKVDRAAMGVSLETRIPFLDHRIVEFAWTLPLEMKIRQQQGKQVLRKLLYRYVPPPLIERPKMGFGIPLAQWLRSELRDWGATLLNPTRLQQEGYLHPDLVWQYWQEHQTGKRNWAGQLWEVLMFQSWLERCF
ncbi:asparagine synthase (glutamine-hydrolyzing) [Thermosynechococcus sp. PP45]|uniref:asparagine synthase (glutamine-hydrolyzing) n=1 Tax=unclassified Thermosynechococcus TaxID=2622553 RepID=UPI00267129C4|nr:MULTISPECIES: asparagine synthase (glutamine-hydrolyzing) [unclassified Thermosynechococcus]WKT81961.1 asparagine synthase (glutamine-hydrolyzing) [Thermosynechococcus sp. PP45]WNC25574.1 asparagine synthase (glutamine-hydrolyzing) [Thermosynechococcus sp. PP551]WNC28153.1 asparagine synthase (glutamine-hydrolyzing) [Thermosynechococcus sp. PP555]WNC61113.1 asparagine synthase (glutamine-hydrolyzing) [Thermosynechococcus sp. QS41]